MIRKAISVEEQQLIEWRKKFSLSDKNVQNFNHLCKNSNMEGEEVEQRAPFNQTYTYLSLRKLKSIIFLAPVCNERNLTLDAGWRSDSNAANAIV